jgi:hypothetical protein
MENPWPFVWLKIAVTAGPFVLWWLCAWVWSLLRPPRDDREVREADDNWRYLDLVLVGVVAWAIMYLAFLYFAPGAPLTHR